MATNLTFDPAQFAQFQEHFHRFMQQMFIKDPGNGGQIGMPSTSRDTHQSKDPPSLNEAKKQIVLFNVPEPSGNFEARKAKDLQIAQQIFQSIVDQFNIVSVQRLGKFDFSQQKPRRLLIHLATESEHSNILKNAKKLKKSPEWKFISMEKNRPPERKGERRVSNKREDTKNVETVTKKETPKKLIPSNPFRNFDAIEPPICKKERNILVIGETGVGKSTWINGIANYMKFDSFDDALDEKKPVCVIPMEFDLYIGEKFEKSTVSMKATTPGSEKNEATPSAGQSCTQAPKVYRFVTDSVAFNLIDTPGIGDTRGVECDMENMRMIMKCVSCWDKIHGICLLLKPNVSRLGLSLRYCIVELLVNLHRHSIPNIAVVFTNSCNTLYKPGDTMTVLRKLFEDVKSVQQNEIPLTGINTFCIDNEAVRMLYAHHKGVQFEKAYVENFSKSWTHTQKETHRLFDYITDLDSHLANETKVASIVRGVTHELCSILADMDEQIQQEQKVLDQQKKQHQILEGKLLDTKKSSAFQGQYLTETPLSYPNTVCCGPDCVETIRDPTTDTLKTFHKKVCLQGCPLRNVPPNQIGAANLRQCSVFANSAGNCSTCGCSWQSHMHILYLQTMEVGNVEIKDEKSNENNDLLARQIESKSVFILESQQKLAGSQEKYQKAQRLARPYFKFLEENSILPLNNAIEEYLEFSIEQLEKTLKAGGDRYDVEKLKKLLAIHQQQKFLAKLEESESNHEKITFANYSLKISELKEDPIVAVCLEKSTAYQKLFEIPKVNVVEVVPKANRIIMYEK